MLICRLCKHLTADYVYEDDEVIPTICDRRCVSEKDLIENCNKFEIIEDYEELLKTCTSN